MAPRSRLIILALDNERVSGVNARFSLSNELVTLLSARRSTCVSDVKQSAKKKVKSAYIGQRRYFTLFTPPGFAREVTGAIRDDWKRKKKEKNRMKKYNLMTSPLVD